MLSESSCEKVDRTGLCQQLFIINSVSSDTHHTREGGREGGDAERESRFSEEVGLLTEGGKLLL